MGTSKILSAVAVFTLTQAVSLHLDIKRGGSDPIVELRMHELFELISQKRELGYRTAVTHKVKSGGNLRKALRQAIHNNQRTSTAKSSPRKKSAKSTRFNRYKTFHSS